MLRFITIICSCCSLCLAGQNNDTIKSATDAMAAGLWEVAAIHLHKALQSPELNPQKIAEISILLAENLIRDNQAAAALEILRQSNLASHPHQAFWSAQALAGLGRFADAVEAFESSAADPSHPFQSEAALTASTLLISLGKTKDALTILQPATLSPNPATARRAQLRQVEILIDLQRHDDARQILPPPSTPQDPLATLLEATLLLAEDQAAEADILFSSLLANPQGQSILRHHQAAIGKADSLKALDKPESASVSLLTFIQENPDSPLLEPMFRRIIAWLPETINSPEHPTLTRLAAWIPATPPPNIGPLAPANSAVAAWPTITPVPDIVVFAIHTRALALQRIDSPTAIGEAKALLQRIRILAPEHFLTPRSILNHARYLLTRNEPDQAFAILENLSQYAKSPHVIGQAAFINAKIAFDKNNPALAAELFDQAAHNLSGTNSESALLNAAIARILNQPDQPITIQHQNPTTAAELNTNLALERALTTEDPLIAKNSLDAFLTANPGHPRTTEARIASIEAALRTTPPDLSLARAQIETLRDSPQPPDHSQNLRINLAEIRLEDLAKDTEKTIELASRFIETHPNTSEAAEAAFIQGRNYFQAGDYNQARIVLEKAASIDPSSQLSQAAILLAARAAALGATAQSREQALGLYDQALAIDGPLKTLALLEKARLNIDLNRFTQAIETLRDSFQNLSQDDPARLPTGLLLAEAIYGQGDSQPENLIEALEINNQLLSLTDTQPALLFRLQYLRGLILEKLPDPENPGRTRLAEALAAYHSVLDRPTEPPPAEWEFFERSGFRALALLENANRWQAAIAIAEKIASFRGPRSEEAATRARQIRLKNLIWEN